MITMHCLSVLSKNPKLACSSQIFSSYLKVGGYVTGILIIDLERA